MEKIENSVYKVLAYCCGVLILAMTLLIFMQVFCRYALENSLSWSEELGRYMFIWITFLGAPVALKAKAHVALDIVLQRVHGVTKKTLVHLNALLTFFLSGTIVYAGIKLVILGMGQKSSALFLPMPLVYAVIPVGGLFLLYFAICEFIKDRKALSEGK